MGRYHEIEMDCLTKYKIIFPDGKDHIVEAFDYKISNSGRINFYRWEYSWSGAADIYEKEICYSCSDSMDIEIIDQMKYKLLDTRYVHKFTKKYLLIFNKNKFITTDSPDTLGMQEIPEYIYKGFEKNNIYGYRY